MSDRAGPRVSLGMPVYNGGRYVAEALKSLLEQDFEDFELIICDNGSSDDTEEICRAHARRDSRIRLYRNDRNIGAAGNYNRVFELSRGEFFKWASHDDICGPSYLRRCVAAFDAGGGDLALCYGKTILIDEKGAVIRPYEDGLDLRFAAPHRRLRHMLRHLILCNALMGMMRRCILATTRLIAPFPASDTVLLTELALRGRFHEIPDRLFFRRVHPQASMHANRTAAEVAGWYDPALRERIRFPRARLLAENMRAVLRSPLSRLDQLACLQVLWEERLAGNRQWRILGGEVKSGLKQYLHRLRMPAGRPDFRQRSSHPRFTASAPVSEAESAKCL